MALILAKDLKELELFEQRMKKEIVDSDKALVPQTPEEIHIANECATWFFAHDLFYKYAIVEPTYRTGVLPKDTLWNFPYCADLAEWLVACKTGDYTEVRAKCASFTKHFREWFATLDTSKKHEIRQNVTWACNPVKQNDLPYDIQLILGLVCACLA
jgi:hypothetical protein